MCLDNLLCGLWKVFHKVTYIKQHEADFSFFVIPRCAPGEPAKRVNAGMTVLGGMMVLSAIFVQSLMIVNFPCGSKSVRIREKVRSERCKRRAYSR